MWNVILKFVVRIAPWHVLKVIGASYISTVTIVVPLFGYLIFFGKVVDGVYSIDFGAMGQASIVIDLSNTMMRLKMTYVGLSVIGLTTIVFRILCPKEIGAYRDHQQYIESSVATIFPEEVDRMLIGLSTKR